MTMIEAGHDDAPATADHPVGDATHAQMLVFYQRLLKVQARLQFPFEKGLYSNPDWKSARRVLDFGCGDGSYAALLADNYPDKTFVGFDANPEMFDIAYDAGERANLSFRVGWEKDDANRFDFAVLRYVVMHIRDRPEALRDMSRRLARKASILIIEPDDGVYRVAPPLPVLDKAIRGIKSDSVARDLKGDIDADLERIGFRLVDFGEGQVTSESAGLTIDLLKYAGALVEIGLHRVMRPAEKAQLLDWFRNEDSMIRFGFHARRYAR